MVDRFGVWLSARQIRRAVPTFAGKRVGDFGCGFQASFARTILADVAGLTLVDVALADDLKADPRIRAIEGQLPGALAELPAASLDVVMIVSVLEHVADPAGLLARGPAPAGAGRRGAGERAVVAGQDATWSSPAFRLRLGPAGEMDDHKMYYDVRDLWPMLVAAGFRPSQISCFSHKFGLNTFAVCKAEP